MSYALSFALLSLTAAGCLDVTFRRYALKARSRGMYVFGCGLIWALLQAAFIAGSGQGLAFGGATLAYGLAAGLILVLANILLIESLTHLEVSLGSTIYRLNTILVVLLSFLFLGEALGPLKLTGIAFGIAAVLLLYGRPTGVPNAMGGSIPGLFLCAALAASALRALYGILSKTALSQGAEAQGMLLTAALCWVLGGLAYAALRERRLRLTREKALYALFSGSLVFVVVNALIEALKYGDASIVVPVANLSFVVAMAISLLLVMERLSLRKALALGSAALSIFLLAQVGN
jgi:drug/metabolite transporter (DMT)-like permease